jgi:asparagine synthase (glutamine-hydrolysing)
MCGIVGVASVKPINNRASLLAMRDTLAHRGPDDAGAWWSAGGQVGLAQQRLAIIDLSPAGHQPMADVAGQLQIVFNGEIYNHRALRRSLEQRGHLFRTASDTEVILEAYREWGDDCLMRLNGMFAFALYDAAQRRLFIARDRAGEKPLFYRFAAGRLSFASELKALMADPSTPRELDLAALDFYLAYGYVAGEMCMLKGIHKLPAAHALSLELETGKLLTWRYWQLPQPASTNESKAADEELIEELEALLLDSVRLRLIADVPVGVLLSGGIDSSLITALAARVSSTPVKTFTVAFPGHAAFNEAPYARQVAEHFATEHTELVADPASVELLPELARQYDEPMADSSMVPTYLVSRHIRRHATVALGGDGGDELFGGYWHYRWVQRQERLRRLVPLSLRMAAGAAAARWMPVGARGRNHLIGFSDGLGRALAHINLFFDAASRRSLLSPGLNDGSRISSARVSPVRVSPESYKANLSVAGASALQRATALDFSTYLADDLLVKVDRASMLTSLEVRAPWLDHRLIEFAFGRVPDRLRATEGECKVLPRRLAERLLPSSLDLKRKQGFSLPLGSWFKGDWGRFITSVLADADPLLFNQQAIRKLIAAQQHGYNNTQRLFAVAMFELWRRCYHVGLPNGAANLPASEGRDFV